jgi:arylformamidase
MPKLTPEFVEFEYNNRARVPEHPAIFSRWAEASRAARSRLAGQLNVPYGKHPRQVMDVFPVGERRHWVVFIHGGYWRAFSKDESTWLAAAYVDQGLSVAMLNYRLCPEAQVAEIIGDCQTAIATLARLPALQGASRVVLAGHSVGGHMVATLLSQGSGPTLALGFDDEQIVGGVSLSGLFDLEPLTLFSANQDLSLTVETARALSPIHSPAPRVPLRVLVGEHESQEYHRQQQLIQQAWPSAVARVEAVAGANHFTILDAHAAKAQSHFDLLHDSRSFN